RIIVVFGSPLPLEDHAWLAMQTANEMSERVGEYKTKLLSTNKPAIKIGIGIHSESVLSRNLSATKGMDFMAIGADVHVGYRLEGICKQYGCNIVISQKTYQLCQEKIRVRELDFIRLPGESRPVTIYEYLGLDGDSISEQKQEALKHYQKGREHYLNRKFALAMGEFAKVMELETNDKAAAIQLKRCQHWLKTPPPEDKEWDGCWPGN
ncbi:MAG TPA: adenylate/guanylate cyclase domain-containing protein, partial [Halomicronema sp.]